MGDSLCACGGGSLFARKDSFLIHRNKPTDKHPPATIASFDAAGLSRTRTRRRARARTPTRAHASSCMTSTHAHIHSVAESRHIGRDSVVTPFLGGLLPL